MTLELIRDEYLLQPKEKTLEGINELLTNALKDLKKIQDQKSPNPDELLEKIHRVKILELKQRKFQNVNNGNNHNNNGKQMNNNNSPRSSVASISSISVSRQDSAQICIEKVNDEFDDSSANSVLRDALSLISGSVDVEGFLSYFQEETKESGNPKLIPTITNQLEKEFGFGDERFAKAIFAVGNKAKNFEDFEDAVQNLSAQYTFSDSFTTTLFNIISNEKSQDFDATKNGTKLEALQRGIEKKVSELFDSIVNNRDRIIDIILEMINFWGELLQVTNHIISFLIEHDFQEEVDQAEKRKNKLAKNIANILSTVSYIRASIGSWNLESATYNLSQATKAVWKVTLDLIQNLVSSNDILSDHLRGRKLESRDKKKLTKFFGVEPPQPKIKKPMDEILSEDSFSRDIFFTMEGRVKGGTLDKLVERLTHHSVDDTEFTESFLTTYQSFTTPINLLNMLYKRFHLETPQKLSPSESEHYFEMKVKPIRFRVTNVIIKWIQMDSDTFEDEVVKKRLNEFVSTSIKSFLPAVSHQIDSILFGGNRRTHSRSFEKAPNPIFTKTTRALDIHLLDPLEVARQLTLIDFKIFESIKNKEFFKLSWSKQDGSFLSPNITKLARRSTQLTSLVCHKILSQPEAKDRAEYLKQFVHIASKCLELRNFNSAMSILGGLMSSSVHRLSRTWRLLGKKENQLFGELKETMSYHRNFGKYREYLKTRQTPCLPFLGLYLTDLTFIEDGNKDCLPNSDFINFDKRSKCAKVLLEINHFQNSPYSFQPVPQIQELLLNIDTFEKDEDEFYQISINLERKDTDGEVLARVVHNS